MSTNLVRTFSTIVFMVLFKLSMNAQCTDGNGIIMIEDITVDAFKHLSIPIAFDSLNISQGSVQSIIVKGDSNVLDNLNFNTSPNSLDISFPIDSCYENYSLIIDIVISEINEVVLSGVGDAFINDFGNTGELTIDNSGTGNIQVGAFKDATFLSVTNSGIGDITMNNDFDALTTYQITNIGTGNFYGCAITADTVSVLNTGIGDVSVTANNYLEVVNTGIGNVEYYGMPEIDSDNTGLGAIIEGQSINCIITTSSSETDFQKSLNVFPNPTSGILNFSGIENLHNKQAIIVDIRGRVVMSFDIPLNNHSIDISHLQPGSYFLKIGEQTTHIILL